MHLTCVVGARPNFMKMAPILSAAADHPDIRITLVHTGQHYDKQMSDQFFAELSLPNPDIHLGVGSGSHAQQTAKVMMEFDTVLDGLRTDMVIVVGDVNSTLSCALVAVKRSIPVAHVEAGLRSGDRTMPEEINRIVTDQLSDLLFLTEKSARENLTREGIEPERIHFVGNVMIDTLTANLEKARQRNTLERLNLSAGGYAVCTLHRPSNVDSQQSAENTVAAVNSVRQRIPVVWPIHPRTRARLTEFQLIDNVRSWPNVQIVDPLGYLDFLCLTSQARVVFTDSGGLQEETTALRIPCLTFRENTERPITISEGSNRLVGTNSGDVAAALESVLSDRTNSSRIPDLWDGHASERIINVIRGFLNARL
jgi:UDP-N-acetylglucosamine 2-epimerase (non-hydrolysing)